MKKHQNHPPNEILNIEDKRAVPVSKSQVFDEHLENKLIDNVHRELFFKLCKDFYLNVNTLFTKILTLREKHKLNIFLRTIKEKYGIRIIDSLIFLEEKHAKFNQLLKNLDQENTYLLKVEASEISYKYKLPSSNLKDFMEFEKNDISK